MKNDLGKSSGMHLWWRGRRAKGGQSLVEFALTLPVLLTILAGVVEVSNILMIYNRVQVAAREGARFGAAGGDDDGVMGVVRQSSTGVLAVEDDQMRVWVMRPVIDVTAASVWSWVAPTTAASWGDSTVVKCVFPTTGCAADDVVPLLSPTTVLSEIKSLGSGADARSISGTRFVITVVAYRSDMILNLPFWGTNADGTGRFPMYAYSIIRQEVEQAAITQKGDGCSAYPIALSHTRVTGANKKSENETFDVPLNDESGIKDGYRFLSWDPNPSPLGSGAGVSHLISPDTGTCRGSLWFPGSSVNCPLLSYDETPYGGADTTLHRGNSVAYNTATIDQIMAAANNPFTTSNNTGHFNSIDATSRPRALRIIIYNFAEGTNPWNDGIAWQYKIDAFAIVRLISRSGNTLTFSWVKTDNSCGNP